jgi:hypothetical protein
MAEFKNANDLLRSIASVLLWCVVFGVLLVLIWFAFYMIVPGTIYSQAKWFGLTPHEVDIIHYCGIAFVKSCVLILFLFPYLAIQIVLRRK